MRAKRSLAGRWQFRLDPDGVLSPESVQFDREIPVPLPWQAAFPELREYSGFAWYGTTFDVDEEWLAGEVLLDFGAVDYWCAVYINGDCVGEHEGGYMPFRFPIRRFIHAGANTLTLRVYDPVQTSIVIPRWRHDNAPQPTHPPFPAEDVPHGKQEWYINVGGVWQDVALTPVPTHYIEYVRITPDIHTGEAHVSVTMGGAVAGGTVRVSIAGTTAEAAVAGDEVRLAVRVPDAQWWTPENPALYTAEVRLTTDAGEDVVETRFGFREILARDGELLLNGEPLYLLCALDQDMYPDTIYTIPSDDFLRDQFTKAKQLGLNSLRCHIKPPDPRYLDLADEMGLLIWSEIPSWRTFHLKTTVHPSATHLDDAIKQRARAILRDMITRDYNHPSLIIWTIINEDWGTALLMSEHDRAWVAEMVDTCKQLDPTRLVVDNSPCPANWGLSVHVKSDLDDFHIYTNIPDQAEQFEQFVEQFGHRPLWSFSNTGDAQRTGKEPLVLSEFGNWAMPSLAQWGGGEADWFGDLGAWWSPFEGEPGYPKDVLARFDAYGLSAIWPDYEAFAAATQWHAYNALKFELAALRRQPAIKGYVITELSDIYWESNGLLDFARNPKAFHDHFAQINAPDVIVPQVRRYAFWDDETVRVTPSVSHYSAADWKGATARGTAAEATVFEEAIGALARGETRPLERFAWHLPTVSTGQTVTLHMRVENGAMLAQHDLEVLVLPASGRRATFAGEVAVMMRPEKGGAGSLGPTSGGGVSAVPEDNWMTGDEATPGVFSRAMQMFGYGTRSAVNENTRLVVTNHPTAEMLRWVAAGGDMLFLAGDSKGSPFFWRQARSGAYGGNWVTSFSWLRPGVYRRLDGVTNPVTLPFTDIMPEYVILGLPVEDAAVHGDFLAGQISGWVRLPALHTVQFRYGRGRVVMTTYRLRETTSYHPVAAAMLHDLIEHLTSDACQPVLKANY